MSDDEDDEKKAKKKAEHSERDEKRDRRERKDDGGRKIKGVAMNLMDSNFVFRTRSKPN